MVHEANSTPCHIPVLAGVSGSKVSKQALQQLADQAVTDEVVHLLATTNIQTGDAVLMVFAECLLLVT